MEQEHGLALALHLMKLLKSSRRFIDLMTNKFDNLKDISCIGYIHEKLRMGMVPSRTNCPELKSHLFSFLYPGTEGELTSLYECVKSSMFAIHSQTRKPNDLIQIAQLW